MRNESSSMTVTITFDADVYYERQVTSGYGADADGRRGSTLVELVPTHVELHQDVPEPVAGYLQTCAIVQFMRHIGN